MATHVFRSLNVFVPYGNQTSAESILAGVVPAVNHDELTATVIVSVFEYRNLTRVKNIPMFEHIGPVIITNPEVFSCGKWYSPSEYIDMLKEEFVVWKMTIFDVNQFGLEFEQTRSGKDSVNAQPQIVCSPDGGEINFINESIVAVAESPNVFIDIPTKHAKFRGSRLVIVGKDVVKPPTDPTLFVNIDVDTNNYARLLSALRKRATPAGGAEPDPPAAISNASNMAQSTPPRNCGVQGCNACTKT